MSAIEKEFRLNQKQTMCFRIIANWFIKKFVTKDPDTPPLSMVMTGPGGTGKTYVVNAVRELMKCYVCVHQIRFLAPTGSTASLIDGMTIHKGLGIRIKANRNGKSNRHVGESVEDYTVLISVQSRTKLREEWRNVEIVFIDECSMLSLQFMCEIDHALRYVKERPDDPFGSVVVVCAGDFCQYPPVVGSPLYSPVSGYANQTEQEILKRLGRLAWKTVNTVVTLSEQQRMRTDPEFGGTTQCLRTWECTYEDVDLFNSRVIRSDLHPDGIDLSLAGNSTATAIVATNVVREQLNLAKARANCGQGSQPLIICAANDKVKDKSFALNNHLREYLLQLEVTALSSSGSLPALQMVLKARSILSIQMCVPMVLPTAPALL
jgi:hypothetical protein